MKIGYFSFILSMTALSLPAVSNGVGDEQNDNGSVRVKPRTLAQGVLQDPPAKPLTSISQSPQAISREFSEQELVVFNIIDGIRINFLRNPQGNGEKQYDYYGQSYAYFSEEDKVVSKYIYYFGMSLLAKSDENKIKWGLKYSIDLEEWLKRYRMALVHNPKYSNVLNAILSKPTTIKAHMSHFYRDRSLAIGENARKIGSAIERMVKLFYEEITVLKAKAEKEKSVAQGAPAQGVSFQPPVGLPSSPAPSPKNFGQLGAHERTAQSFIGGALGQRVSFQSPAMGAAMLSSPSSSGSSGSLKAGAAQVPCPGVAQAKRGGVSASPQPLADRGSFPSSSSGSSGSLKAGAAQVSAPRVAQAKAGGVSASPQPPATRGSSPSSSGSRGSLKAGAAQKPSLGTVQAGALGQRQTTGAMTSSVDKDSDYEMVNVTPEMIPSLGEQLREYAQDKAYAFSRSAKTIYRVMGDGISALSGNQ